ncbi:MAG: hypothetical protein IJA75_04365 [Oscillospiraceae bacterium]|nr:hypothetical protein [Oscillospiraceae bacterium]
MYHFTIPMALMDFVPVFCFGYGAALLQRDLYGKMRKSHFALFAAGTINIFAAGFLKALWKLLYAAGICDFAALNTMFLPVQSIGFLLAGLGIVLMLSNRKSVVLAAAPPIFSGSIIFIMMMVLGLGSICTVLSILAVKMKKKGAVVLFIAAFLCSMGMGAMAGQDVTQAWVNWVEQGINCVGQGLLMWGVIILDRAGLKEFKL